MTYKPIVKNLAKNFIIILVIFLAISGLLALFSEPFEKKEELLSICYYYRTVQINWGTGVREKVFLGNINKFGITETAGIIGEQKVGYESEKNFAVQLSMIVGTDK